MKKMIVYGTFIYYFTSIYLRALSEYPEWFWINFNLWHLDFDNFENVHGATCSYQYCLLAVNKRSKYLQSTLSLYAWNC